MPATCMSVYVYVSVVRIYGKSEIDSVIWIFSKTYKDEDRK